MGIQQSIFNAIVKTVVDDFGSQFHLNDLKAIENNFQEEIYYNVDATSVNGNMHKFLSSLFKVSDGKTTGLQNEFLTQFTTVINSLTYSLSADDQNKLDTARVNNANNQNAFVNQFIAAKIAPNKKTFNEIINVVLTWGNDLTWDSLTNNVTDLKKALPKRPPGADQILPSLATVVSGYVSVSGLMNATLLEGAIRQQVLDNVSSPTADNGGQDDGSGSFLPGYTVSPPSTEFLKQVEDTGSSISINIEVTTDSNKKSTCSVNGSAGITFFGEWFVGNLGGGASYAYSSDVGSNSKMSMKITWKGVAAMKVDPEPYNHATKKGWYISTAIENAAHFQEGTTGWSFSPKPKLNFEVNGDFGRLSDIVVSQQPSIEITYTGSDYESVEQKWEANQNTGFTIFGIFKFGASASQSEYSSNFQKIEKGFTVIYNPPPFPGNVSLAELQAYLLGAQLDWPGARTFRY